MRATIFKYGMSLCGYRSKAIAKTLRLEVNWGPANRSEAQKTLLRYPQVYKHNSLHVSSPAHA